MMSKIMHATACADCCNGPTNHRSNCFKLSLEKADIKSVKTETSSSVS